MDKYDHPVKPIVDAWVNLVGGVKTGDGEFTLVEWEKRADYNTMMAALCQDESGITTYMLADYFCDAYAADKHFNLTEIVDNAETLQDEAAKLIAARRILAQSPLREKADYFVEQVERAMQHYGATRPEVLDMIRDRHNLAILRRDAYESLHTLQQHVFSTGATSGERPRYIQHVHLFWNINSLVSLMANAQPGVSLNLIQSPDGYQSHFCFVVKNGENLMLLTDRTRWTHPLQGGMTRRPDRHMDERAAKNRFPYSLMDIEYNEKGRLHLKRSKALVPYQEDFVRLKAIAELEPDEIIWITMMLGLIAERFWQRPLQPKQLSYVAENASGGLPQTMGSKRVVLPRVTLDDMRAEKLDQFRQSTRFNQHLEGRFDQLFDEQLLNLTVGDSSEQLFLPKAARSASEVVVDDQDRSGTPLHGLDLTVYETEERLRKDQLYIARYNYARLVQRELEREFWEQQLDVRQWYREHVTANLSALLQAIRRGNFFTTVEREAAIMSTATEVAEKNIFSLRDELWMVENCWMRFSRQTDTWKTHRCYFTGAKASHVAFFGPTSADGIAKLAGCGVDEIPEPIRHFNREMRYRGNSILDRIDPLEWAARDPWSERERFDVVIALSKRAYNRIMKGDPPEGA